MGMPSSFELDKIMRDTTESLYYCNLFKQYVEGLKIDDELKRVLIHLGKTDMPKMLATTPIEDGKKMMENELSAYHKVRKDNPSDYQKQTNHLISVLAYSLLSGDLQCVKNTCEVLYIIESRNMEYRNLNLNILAGILERMGKDSSVVKEAMKFRPDGYRLLGNKAEDVGKIFKSFLTWYNEKEQKENELLDKIGQSDKK